VTLARCMLSVELVEIEDGWLWHSGMTGSCQGLGLVVMIGLWQKM
jgi:hypothetical protein